MTFDLAVSEEFSDFRDTESPGEQFGTAGFSLDDASGQPSLPPEWQETAENTMAPHATPAPGASVPWHRATVAPHATQAHNATVAPNATVRGELRVPNAINFRLFPTLDPYAKTVYYELFLLSHGFRRDTCVVSLGKLSQRVLISPRKVQNTITYLERRGLVRRLQPVLGGASKGIVYQVLVPGADSASDPSMAGSATEAPHATLAPGATAAPDATVAPRANNKYDDDLKNNHHQRGAQHLAVITANRDHSGAAPPRERKRTRKQILTGFELPTSDVRATRWSQSDTEAYDRHRLDQIPAGSVVSVLDAVVKRIPVRINSFKYFIREILAVPDPRNRAWQKKQLGKIVARIHESAVGRAGYSGIDFLEDVKCACAREGVTFNDDLYNELTR